MPYEQKYYWGPITFLNGPSVAVTLNTSRETLEYSAFSGPPFLSELDFLSVCWAIVDAERAVDEHGPRPPWHRQRRGGERTRGTDQKRPKTQEQGTLRCTLQIPFGKNFKKAHQPPGSKKVGLSWNFA